MIKKIFNLFLFLFIIMNAKGQLGLTKNEVIEILDGEYSEGKTETGTEYISISKEYLSKEKESYTEQRVIYFKKNKNNKITCNSYKIIIPFSQINTFLDLINGINIDNYENTYYKENNTVFMVKESYPYCYLEVLIDELNSYE